MPKDMLKEQRRDKLTGVLDLVLRNSSDVRYVDEEEERCDKPERDVPRPPRRTRRVLGLDLAENRERIRPTHEGEVDFDNGWGLG